MALEIGILRPEDVRPELVNAFGEYPEMFENLLRTASASEDFLECEDLIFTSYAVNQGVYPTQIDSHDPIRHACRRCRPVVGGRRRAATRRRWRGPSR